MRPLTSKQTAFVAHLMAGATQADAVVSAGYSAQGAAQAGARLAKHPAVAAELDRQRQLAARASRSAPDADPLDFLRSIWQDKTVHVRLRVQAATAALVFTHPKATMRGAKDAATTRAASGKFAASKTPPGVLPFRRRDPE